MQYVINAISFFNGALKLNHIINIKYLSNNYIIIILGYGN